MPVCRLRALEWSGNLDEMREFAGAAFRLHAGHPQLLDDRFGLWADLHDGDRVVCGDNGFYLVDPRQVRAPV